MRSQVPVDLNYGYLCQACLHHSHTGYVGQIHGRIQDLKKEGAQGIRGLVFKLFLANLGDFQEIGAKRSGRARPPAPPPLDPRLQSFGSE